MGKSRLCELQKQSRGRSWGWVIALLALPLFASLPARGDELPTVVDAEDAAVTSKLILIESALDNGEIYAQRWWGGWLLTFGGAAIGAGAGSFVLGSHEAPVLRISALRSSLGVASVLFVPYAAAHGPSDLHALPESTPAERKIKLDAARRTLRNAAEYERLGRSWFAHLGSLAVNAAFSIWIWQGYHQPAAAALSIATGLFASEGKIWTQPTRAIDDEKDLLDTPELASRGASQKAASFASRITVAPLPGGVALGMHF